MESIIVDSVSKEFRIGFKKHQSALARFISLFSGREPKKILRALKDISFTVRAGEIIGIIGKNGSGKSTLLRIIAGIYSKDCGRIGINGNILSLIDLGSGMLDRLTMKENIYLVGSLFGLSQKTIRQRFDSIVGFSELQDFVNTKLYQFSSGMLQRLAFSIAIHCNPDILLLDEVFEIGDKDFKKKSAEKIRKLVKNGATAVLVSHELWMIERYCSRVIWLDKGRIVKEGKTKDVITAYNDR